MSEAVADADADALPSLPGPPGGWRLRLVGYGEVGRILAEDLVGDPRIRDVAAFDRKLGSPDGASLEAHAREHGIRLAASAADLVADADLVISAVTASQALAVAQACAGAVDAARAADAAGAEDAAGATARLPAGAFFLDLNSASPSVKQAAGALVDASGGRYVEAAVMTSVPPYRLKVPMLLGGPHAATLAPALAALGLDAQVGSDRLGVASATKMCRSIMIKGLEALMMESLTSARAYGVEDAVLASLAETFPQLDWESQASYFFHRVLQHGRRRAEELREVAVTVDDVGLAPLMATAIARRMDWGADLVADGRLPRPAGPPADWRVAADRILATRPGQCDRG